MPSPSNLVIFWFRRDLRLEDNKALFEALNSGKSVLPVFIFDSNILDKLPKNDARVSFIYESLAEIHQKLNKFDSSLLVKIGKPLIVFEELVSKYAVSAVYTNKDYEPYAGQRDAEIGNFLNKKNIKLHKFKDQVIFEENEIVKADGTPYSIYTPYANKWMETLQHKHYDSVTSEELLQNTIKIKFDFPALNFIGFEKSNN